MNDIRYPIGKFQTPEIINSKFIEKWISTIELFPEKLDGPTTTITILIKKPPVSKNWVKPYTLIL